MTITDIGIAHGAAADAAPGTTGPARGTTESGAGRQPRSTSGRGPGRRAVLREISAGIGRLASRRRCAAARQVHHGGISLAHLQVLWILQEHGPLPVSRLAEWLAVGVPNATGLLDRMEQRGLVERVRDTQDRRVVHVRQTDAGRLLIAEHDGWREELVGLILDPLPDDALVRVAERVSELAAAPLDIAPHAGGPDARPCPGHRGESHRGDRGEPRPRRLSHPRADPGDPAR